jgi:hypothetical protein
MQAAKACQIRKRPFSFELFSDYGQQQVYNECAPYLDFNGIFIIA